MYLYHVFFQVNMLFKIFATNNTLKYRFNTIFELQMPYNTPMFILATTFIEAVYIIFIVF